MDEVEHIEEEGNHKAKKQRETSVKSKNEEKAKSKSKPEIKADTKPTGMKRKK